MSPASPPLTDVQQSLTMAAEHYQAGRLDEAENTSLRVLDVDPQQPAATYILGLIAHQRNDPAQAVALISRALAILPDIAGAHNVLGNALRKLDRLEEAVESYLRATLITPDDAAVHCNLGIVYRQLGRPHEALSCFRKAIDLNPNYVKALGNLGFLQLSLGDFEHGWRNYAWRWKLEDFGTTPRDYEVPLWNGTDLAGRTVFVYPEQGLGDFIQFSRYIPLVAKRGGQVVVEVPKQLQNLFPSFEGVRAVVISGQSPGPFDVHVPLLDLPGLLGQEGIAIPPLEHHLSVPAAAVEKWRTRLSQYEGVRVGLVWGGNPHHKNDRNRSLDPKLLRSLLDIDGVIFFSLQVGRDGEAAEAFGTRAVDLNPDILPFVDTAGAMMNLDLIISVDSAPAHLAGALELPVWTLLQFVPDWRWLLDREDTPWYPTMRLFRQQQRGDWPGLIDRLGRELKALAGGHDFA